jgi:short-subunit dehydrogenase
MNIIITGGSKGIGRSIAIRFVKAGFAVAVCSRNKAHLDNLKETLKNINPKAEILIYPCDMGNRNQVKMFAENIRHHWDKVDVLVNNAGIFTPDNILNAPENALEDMMNINLFGSYTLTRELADMLPGKTGYVFNICSVAGLNAYPSGSLYTITKHAMLGFSRALREEMKQREIRVTTVLPGAVYTDSWRGTDLPEDRFMPPEDIAETIYNHYCLSGRTVVEEIVLRPMEGDI